MMTTKTKKTALQLGGLMIATLMAFSSCKKAESVAPEESKQTTVSKENAKSSQTDSEYIKTINTNKAIRTFSVSDHHYYLCLSDGTVHKYDRNNLSASPTIISTTTTGTTVKIDEIGFVSDGYKLIGASNTEKKFYRLQNGQWLFVSNYPTTQANGTPYGFGYPKVKAIDGYSTSSNGSNFYVVALINRSYLSYDIRKTSSFTYGQSWNFTSQSVPVSFYTGGLFMKGTSLFKKKYGPSPKLYKNALGTPVAETSSNHTYTFGTTTNSVLLATDYNKRPWESKGYYYSLKRLNSSTIHLVRTDESNVQF